MNLQLLSHVASQVRDRDRNKNRKKTPQIAAGSGTRDRCTPKLDLLPVGTELGEVICCNQRIAEVGGDSSNMS